VRLRATGFKGRAERIDDTDLRRTGVSEDEVHALLNVETTGTGFDDHGRPKVLFEGRVFYRCLPPAKHEVAVKQGLACQKWGQIPYGKTSEQYGRLERALLIDEAAALKACSGDMGGGGQAPSPGSPDA
jgi:N-acetylmuramidase